jgi:hypothetical protein
LIPAMPKSSISRFVRNQTIGCLNVKSEEERVVYKELNSTGTLIQRTTMEAPQALCIT